MGYACDRYADSMASPNFLKGSANLERAPRCVQEAAPYKVFPVTPSRLVESIEGTELDCDAEAHHTGRLYIEWFGASYVEMEEMPMYPSEQYVIFSLELHLFFARIMKEHALFLMAGFPPANPDFSKTAKKYKCDFEELLSRAITLSDGVIRRKVLNSGEIVTPFTPMAEQQTEHLTGIEIDRTLTTRENLLRPGAQTVRSRERIQKVRALNQDALRLLDGLISFQEQILSCVLSCQMFTMNYPLLIEHITREAKLYREYVHRLEKNGNLDPQAMGQLEQFWNQIMMEHALFIRGLLDPTENELIETAGSFADDYAALLSRARAASDQTLVRKEALAETQKFRAFKTAGVKGIEGCKIRSLILPLLADHVLREANHYIRLLSE